jgi:GT2 family glycosyltransferase
VSDRVGGARIHAVLLNWNDWEQAVRCLDAVRASDGVDLDVLVVDNGSTGEDLDRLRGRLGEGRVLALPENTGYAGGMNAGLAFWRQAGGTAPVLVLTPDAAVQPDTLRRLAAELDANDEAGIAGPLVVHARDGAGWVSAGGSIDVRRARVGPIPAAPTAEPFDADWIDGCCMLIRRELVERLSFDERFFIYFEEADFCCRARREGWRVRVVPDTTVDHPKSFGTLPSYYFYYMVRNRYLFWQKNFGVGMPRVAATVVWATVRSWASALRAVVVPRRRAERRGRLRDARLQLRAALAGTRDHLRRRYGRMPDATMPPAAR